MTLCAAPGRLAVDGPPEPNVPFGGVLASGTGARFGGTANLNAFTETRWVTIRADIASYPF
jgi:benzaldehyde dehydrogenase (NAD)